MVHSHIAFVRFTVNMDLTPDHHMSIQRTVALGGTVKVTAAAAAPVVQRTAAAGGTVVPPDVIRQVDGVTEIGNRTAAGVGIAGCRKVQTIHTGVTAPVPFKQVGGQFHVLVVRIITAGIPALGTHIDGTAVAARPVVAEHVVFKDHRRTVVTGIRVFFIHHKRKRTADSAIRMVVFKDAVGDFEAVEFGETATPVHTAGSGGTVVAKHRVINIKVMVNAAVETDHTARTPERSVVDKDAAVDIHRGAGTDQDHTAGGGRRVFKMAVPDRQRVFGILRIVAAAAEVDGTAVNVALARGPHKGIIIKVEAIDRHRGTGCRFVAVVVEPAGGGTAIDETVAVAVVGHVGSVAGHADPVGLDRAVRIVNIFTVDRHRGTDSGDQCPQQIFTLVRVVLKTGGGCTVRLRRTVNRRDPHVGIDHTVGVGDGVVAEHRVFDRHGGPVVQNDTAAGGVVGIGAVVHIVAGHNAVKEGVGDRYLTRRCEGKHTGIAFSGFRCLEAVLHIADFQIVDGRHDRRTLDKGTVRRSIVGRTGPDVGNTHVLDVQHCTVDLRGFMSLPHIDHVEGSDITLAVMGGVVIRICRNAVFLELCLLVVDINVLQGHFITAEPDHTIGMHIGDGSTGVVAFARGGIRHGPDRSRARIFQIEISALEEDQPVVTGNRSLLGIGLGRGHTDIVDGDVTADGQVVPQELDQTAIDGTAAVNPHAVHRERTAEEGKVLPHELDQTAAVPVGDPVGIKVGLVGIAVHFDIDKGGIAVESQVSAVNTGSLRGARRKIDHTAGTATIVLLEGDVLKAHIPVELHLAAHTHIEHAAGTATVNVHEGIDTVGCGNSMSLPCRRHIRIHIDIDVLSIGAEKTAFVVIRIAASSADHIVNHNVGHRDVALNVGVIDPAALVPGSDPFKTGVGQRQVAARFSAAEHDDRTAAPAVIKCVIPGRIEGDHPLDQMVVSVVQPERAVRTIVQTAENGVVEGGITGVDPHRTAGERDRTDKCRVVHGQVGAVKVQRTGSVRIILLVPRSKGLVVNILAGGAVPLHIVPGGILHKVFVCSRIVCSRHIVCLGDRGELQRIKCHFAGRTIPQNIAIVLLHVEVHAVGGRSIVLGCGVVRLGNHFLKLPCRAGPFRIKIVDGQVGVVHVFRERIVRQVRGVTGTVESDRPEVRAVIFRRLVFEMNIFDGDIGQRRLRVVSEDRIFLQELRGEVIQHVAVFAEVIHLTEGFEVFPIQRQRSCIIITERNIVHIGKTFRGGIVEKHFLLRVHHHIISGFAGNQTLSSIVIEVGDVRFLGITPACIQHALQFRFSHIHIDHIVADQHVTHIPFVGVRTVFRSAVLERLCVKFHDRMVGGQVHEQSMTIAARIIVNVIEHDIFKVHFRRMRHSDHGKCPVAVCQMFKGIIADGNRFGTDHIHNQTVRVEPVGHRIVAQIHVVHVAIFTGPFQIVTDKTDDPAGLTTRVETDILDHRKVCFDRQIITVKGNQRTAGTHFFRIGRINRLGAGNADILKTQIAEQFQIRVPHVDRTAFAVNHCTQIVGAVKTQIPEFDIDVVSVNRFISDRVIDREEALTVLFFAGCGIGGVLDRQRVRIRVSRTGITFNGDGAGNIKRTFPLKDTVIFHPADLIGFTVNRQIIVHQNDLRNIRKSRIPGLLRFDIGLQHRPAVGLNDRIQRLLVAIDRNMHRLNVTHGKVQLPVAFKTAHRTGGCRHVCAGQLRQLADKGFTGSTFRRITAVKQNIAVGRNVVAQFHKHIRIRRQIFRIDHNPVQRKITGSAVGHDMHSIIFPVALLFHPCQNLRHGILPHFQLEHICPLGKFRDRIVSTIDTAADHHQFVALAVRADRGIQFIHRKHIGKAQTFAVIPFPDDRKLVHILFIISTYAVIFFAIHTVGNGQIGVCRSVNNISCVGRRSNADAVFIPIRSRFIRKISSRTGFARFAGIRRPGRIFRRSGHHPRHSAFHQRLLHRIHIRGIVAGFRRSLFRGGKFRIAYQITGLVIRCIGFRLLLLNVLHILRRIHCFLCSAGFKQNSVFQLENTHVVAPVVLF